MKTKEKAEPTGKKAGDTIVEVMIVVLVISTVLIGAFIVSSRSAKGVRDAEEHAQAVQYLQGQVELMRSAASRHSGLPSNLNVPFCLDSTTSYPASSGNCLLGPRYSVSIVLSPASVPGAATSTFDLVATWPGITGNTDRASLSYKLAIAP